LNAEGDSLDVVIRELAADGQFAEAATRAIELRELDESLGADPYILRWYDVWIGTLEASSHLDDAGKQALADANALETTIKRYTGNGRFSAAERQIRRQMELRASALGPEHPEVAYSRITLSRCLMSLGKLWEAEEPARAAGNALRDAFGDRHFLSLSALGMIAQIEVAQGEYESARTIFDEIVTLRRNRFGKTDPMLATSLSALANVYLEQKSTLRAERLLREALNINRDAEFEWIPRGENFRASQKVELFRDLARVLLEKGDYAGASTAAHQALDLLENAGMDRPILTTDILGVTARASAETGAYEDAIATATRLFKSRRDRVGSRHPEIVEALSELARIEGEAGQWESSAQNWERAYDLAAEILGPVHPTTLELLDHLVAARLQLGAYTVADSLLRASLIPERESGTIEAMKNSGVLHHPTFSSPLPSSNRAKAIPPGAQWKRGRVASSSTCSPRQGDAASQMKQPQLWSPSTNESTEPSVSSTQYGRPPKPTRRCNPT
jgi:tetratricopeptide (TPR) repeat protein